jgi:hypothetical protein
MTSKIADHEAEMLDRLPQQDKGKANTAKLYGAIAPQFQDLEDALFDLLTLRTVETATGNALDVLGRIVGQPRDGLSDDDYRRFVRARIATNKSRGRSKDIYTVARLVINDDTVVLRIIPSPPACFILNLTGPITDNVAGILLAFEKQAKAAGVRIILQYSTESTADLFTWDTGPGWDVGIFGRAID